jgi:large subunit ribosomal protein L17
LGEVRLGDAADMCMMELVDFNDIYKKDGVEKKTKTRRSRAKKAEGVVEDAKVEGEVNETEDLPTGQAGKAKKSH